MRFDHIEYAEYYHRQQTEGGYPGKLLPFVIDELEGLPAVLDVGSGTGFFSIPLAERGHLVTAVEPSAGMISIMKQIASPEILPSIRICNTTWENWKGEMHDAAISVHSLYPMEDVKSAIKLINDSAEKKIVIVRDSAGMRTLSGLVRLKLGKSSISDLNNEICLILDNLAVSWKSVNIYEERKHIVPDILQEADSIIYLLKLDKSLRSDVADMIKSVLINNNGINFFNAIYSDNAYIFR